MDSDSICFGKTTFKVLVQAGYLLNSVTRPGQEIIPRTSPLLLLAWSAIHPTNELAPCINSLLRIDGHGFGFGFAGYQIERFHAWWEVLNHLIYRGKEISLNQYFRVEQLKRKRSHLVRIEQQMRVIELDSQWPSKDASKYIDLLLLFHCLIDVVY